MGVRWGVYKITNKINNKFYIGSSYGEDGIYKRWNSHINFFKNQKQNKHFQRAWDKYGEENFKFNIICDMTDELIDCIFEERKEKVVKKEQEFLDKLKPYIRENGYNINRYAGGGGSFGEDNPFYNKKHSDENKDRHSQKMKELWKTEEYRQKYYENLPDMRGKNHPMYKYKWSEEQLKRKSESMKGKLSGDKNPNFGKPLKDETKLKLSIKAKERGKFKGGNNPKAKLNMDQVREIRELLKEGKLYQREIAEMYGVTRNTINRIKNNVIWNEGVSVGQ